MSRAYIRRLEDEHVAHAASAAVTLMRWPQLDEAKPVAGALLSRGATRLATAGVACQLDSCSRMGVEVQRPCSGTLLPKVLAGDHDALAITYIHHRRAPQTSGSPAGRG